MQKTALFSIVGVALCTSSAWAQLVNGDFETGVRAPWNFSPAGTASATVNNASANTGNFGISLNATGQGDLNQSFATVLGQVYDWSFDLSRTSAATGGDFFFEFGLTSGFSAPAGNFAYQTFSGTFVGTGTDLFDFNYTGNYFLDNVIVKPQAVAGAPELDPRTSSLPLVTMLGLFLASERRKRLSITSV